MVSYTNRLKVQTELLGRAPRLAVGMPQVSSYPNKQNLVISRYNFLISFASKISRRKITENVCNSHGQCDSLPELPCFAFVMKLIYESGMDCGFKGDHCVRKFLQY